MQPFFHHLTEPTQSHIPPPHLSIYNASHARKALEDGEAQWCAQLCDHLIALNPNSNNAKLLKADALEKLAEDLITATGRNYYLTVAQELRAESKK
ncbi:MAG: hypothetical protein HQ580_07195 [Planctomycetes bacterium]|nr:hypothetical protein [Planctomycetota bacterium]